MKNVPLGLFVHRHTTPSDYEIKPSSQPSNESMPVTTARKAQTITSTTPVVFKAVPNFGHVTLFNSENVSLIFAPTRRNQLGFLFFVLVAFAICYLVRAHAAKPMLGRCAIGLFGLFVFGVLFAERTILGKNESIRIILLVLNTVVVSMLAFRAFKRNFRSSGFNCHNKNSIQKITPLIWAREISLTHF